MEKIKVVSSTVKNSKEDTVKIKNPEVYHINAKEKPIIDDDEIVEDSTITENDDLEEEEPIDEIEDDETDEQEKQIDSILINEQAVYKTFKSFEKRNIIAVIVSIALTFTTVYAFPYLKEPVSMLAALSFSVNHPSEFADFMKIVVEDFSSGEETTDHVVTDEITDDKEPDIIEEEKEEDEDEVEVEEKQEPVELISDPDHDGIVSVITYETYVNDYIVELEEAGHIKNLTTHTNSEVANIASKEPDLNIKINDKPQVLIMHTHATESFMDSGYETYDTSKSFRSTDNSENITSVGKIMSDILNEAGIVTLHDTTQHDYPSYTGSYERSRVTVNEYLEKYPSIKVVLDVHRDGISLSNSEIVSPVATIDGKQAAQIMIISGCGNTDLNIPEYKENLKLASAIQQATESKYENLTRPILFDYRHYNQDLTTGSLLLEMGSHGNSLEQVEYSAELLAEVLVEVLTVGGTDRQFPPF